MGNNLAAINLGAGRPVGIASSSGWWCAWFEHGGVKCFGSSMQGYHSEGLAEHVGDEASEMGDSLPWLNLGTDVRVATMSGQANRMCMVSFDGRVKCWGSGLASGQPGGLIPESFYPGWGDDSGEMGDNLPFLDLGTDFVAVEVAVSPNHSCALSDDGRVKCWGEAVLQEGDHRISGMLGIEELRRRNSLDPDDMGDNLPYVDLGGQAATISAGWDHTCAVMANNKVKCWGDAEHGQLGLGDNRDRGAEPNTMGTELPFVDIGTGRTVLAISCRQLVSCALRDDESVVCWGGGTGDEPGEMGSALPVLLSL